MRHSPVRQDKRVLAKPTLYKRLSKDYELWEGGGPNGTDWILKVPGGIMNFSTKRACIQYAKKAMSPKRA